MSLMGVKKTLVDIWPMKNKRFLVLVDPDTLDDENPKNFCSSIPTISQICRAKGKVIVATSFGRFPGCEMKMASHQRREALDRWREEGGLGLSHFFAGLDGKTKLEVLRKAEELGGEKVPKACSVNKGSGKTNHFSKLSKDLKIESLAATLPDAKTAHGKAAFPFKNLSALPLVETLQQGVSTANSVTFVEDSLNASGAVSAMQPGDVIVLENLRFYANETSPNYDDRHDMAEILASYADVFVNDSFSTAYRNLASAEVVPRLLRHGAAGTVMERELNYFRKIVTHPARPTVCVLGGSRVKDKLTLLRSLMRKVDKVLLAGAVALPFIAASGKSAGRGYDPSPQLKWNPYDKECVSVKTFAKRLMEEAELLGVKIFLPIDFVTNAEVKLTKTPHVTQSGSVPSELFAVDVGPNTVSQFAREVRDCRTVFWVGTLGFTEAGFREGTEAFARVIASSNLISVVGGGHTADAIAAAGVAPNISHICSGSVAQLHVLQGLPLPGVAGLTDVHITTSQQSAAAVNELLRHLPIFANCSAHQLSVLSKKAVRRSHNAGDFIIYDGDRTTSLHVVAKGCLIACPNAAFGQSIAQRYVEKGHAIGQFEFIAQRPSIETVRVEEQDTVTFQLTTSALQEAISEMPELASQLVSNLADPLRLNQQRVHVEAASEEHALLADCALMRKPIPTPDPRGSIRFAGSWKVHLLATLASTAALHKSFAPYFFPYRRQAGTCVLARHHSGLYLKLIHDLIREMLTHKFGPGRRSHDGRDGHPVVAAIIAAMLATPLKLAAQGVPFHELGLNQVVDETLANGAMAVAPVASHALFIRCRSKAQIAAHKTNDNRHTQRPLPLANEVFIAIVCRAAVALLTYPLILRRTPSAMSFRSLLLFMLKQALSLLIELTANKTLRPIAALLPL